MVRALSPNFMEIEPNFKSVEKCFDLREYEKVTNSRQGGGWG